jgi:hypothetical protein
MKKIKLLFLAILISSIAFAQKSFVFLELNPDIPVNVYLNGEKQKIKNNAFIILPNANTGLNKLEIETQNNNISKHTFEVLGSEQGNAYKLKKVGSSFKLEDKLSGELFSDNNKIENKTVVAKNIDNKPFEKELVKKEKKPDYIIEEYKSEPIVKTTPENVKVEKKDKVYNSTEKPIVKPTPPPTAQQGRTYAMYERRKLEQEAKAARYERKELNKSDIDLQLNESKKQISSIKTEIIEAEPNDDNSTISYTTLEASSYISVRCRRIVGDQEFEQTFETFKNKVDDEAKINYFKRKITSECYMTDQIVTLSKEIETQTGRYKFIEAMKENIADIENVRKFRDLFTYKSYRKKITSLFE